MDKKNQNIIMWAAGIAIFFLIATQLPISPWFAIVSKVTCAEGVTNYYPLDGVLTDLKGNQDATNNGAIFIAGKLGSNALEFNGTNYISFLTLPFNLSTGFWMNDYSNVAGWIYKIYENTSILSSTAFLGLNGSVDEIVVGTNITGLSNIQPCYITSYEENVSCKDYARSQVPSLSSGCLNVTGDFYPSCNYSIEITSQYKIENNLCERYFYCQDPCLTTGDCYITNQNCIENLVYDCYLLEDDNCVQRTDYVNCTGANYYSNLTLCQEGLSTSTVPIPSDTTTPITSTPSETIKDKLNQKVFEIAGFEVKLVHLLMILILVIVFLYFFGTIGKK